MSTNDGVSDQEPRGRELTTRELEPRITPLLVVIAIIAILIGLMVPAVQTLHS